MGALGNSHMASQQYTIFLGKQPHSLTTTHHFPWETATFPQYLILPHSRTSYSLGNSHIDSQQHTIFLGKKPHSLTTTHHIPWETATFPHNNTPYSLESSHIPSQQHCICLILSVYFSAYEYVKLPDPCGYHHIPYETKCF